jgi:ferric-dicitrate binding protein FerR (iron transport regulator)
MKERIDYLLNRWISKEITTEEREEFFSLLGVQNHDEDFKQSLNQLWFNTTASDKMKEQVAEEIFRTITGGAKVITMKRSRPWIKWVAAACIIALVGVLANVYLKKNNVVAPPVAITHDVSAPKETRAVITLANGQKVYLDSVDNGTIATETDVNVVKTADGKLVYQKLTANSQQLTAYNTLTNPRGSKVIDMTLSDGSHVWLNSGSSIKYPVAFIGKERVVEITGEAYFEVKHNAQQPFKVHLPNGSIVEDIGTSFNINSYSDEDDIKTTLIEGSVRITPLSPAGGGGLSASPNRERPGVDQGVVLKPGQQAVATGNSLLNTRSADLDEVLAWKNGKFVFNKTDIQTTMRQIARWYDVEIEYKDDVTGFFSGGISRLENASQVLKMLEMTGEVHFKIEGKKVIVMK